MYEKIEIGGELKTNFNTSLFQWEQLNNLPVEFNPLKVFL